MAYAVLRIGRSPRADIRLDDGSVSRRHAHLLVLDDGRLWVVDRSSTNGTWIAVDGAWERIERRAVKRDDRLRFGDVEIVLSAMLGLARTAGAGAVRVDGARAGNRADRAAKPPTRDGAGPAASPAAGGAAVGVGLSRVKSRPSDSLPAGPVRRNPLTGEIIADRDKT